MSRGRKRLVPTGDVRLLAHPHRAGEMIFIRWRRMDALCPKVSPHGGAAAIRLSTKCGNLTSTRINPTTDEEEELDFPESLGLFIMSRVVEDDSYLGDPVGCTLIAIGVRVPFTAARNTLPSGGRRVL